MRSCKQHFTLTHFSGLVKPLTLKVIKLYSMQLQTQWGPQKDRSDQAYGQFPFNHDGVSDSSLVFVSVSLPLFEAFRLVLLLGDCLVVSDDVQPVLPI